MLRDSVSPVERAVILTVALAPLAWAVTARGAEKTLPADVAAGAALFRTHCTTCHGDEGRGDGPRAEGLAIRPADLTQIQRRNGGRFPADKVARIIDGRERTAGHGGAGMPAWGDAFKTSADGYDEAAVRIRIDNLVAYIKTLQPPPAK